MRREDYRATLILMLGLVAATFTGFLREAALAHQLGASRATDIYLIAFTIPEFILVALPIVLTPAFIPLFAQLRLAAGEGSAWRFAGQVLGALLAVLLVVTGLAAAGAPIYLSWLAPGFGAAERAEAMEAAWRMLPALLLMGGATLAGAMLQVYRRFARPALATAVYNLAFVIVLLGLPVAWAVGRAAWGVTLGAAAALLLQATLVWGHRPRGGESTRLRVRPHPAPPSGTMDHGAPAVSLAALGRLIAPMAAGYAVHHAILLVDRAMATTRGAGSVATLNYAYRLALVVGQLSGLAVSTALFPRMAEQAAANDLDGLRGSLANALRFVWLIGLPASLGLILFRAPLVEIIFQRGAFGSADAEAVADVLIWYAVAVLADAVCQPLWRVVYARRRGGIVVAVNTLQTVTRIVLNFALISPLGYNGLALSAALGLSVQALTLGQIVRHQIGSYLTTGWWRGAVRVALGTSLFMVPVALLLDQMPALSPVMRLLPGGVAGGVVCLVSMRLWKEET
ncbi:MAG: polysaccharide biosynthesis C-terminal domain-containing protein [Anaerolineae bacterium]|nr:polysaccharide biosynthesis C-terminal domain-containing protein [Anaerolineae bacterium]